MKNIVKYLHAKCGRLLAASLFVPLAAMLGGCNNDPDVDPYFNLGYYDEEAREIYSTIAGLDLSAVHYTLYSNAQWELTVQYMIDEDLDWVNIWPKSGTGDGRFRVKVAENKDTPYIRKAEIYIVADGVPWDTIRVTQEPVAPRLELNMEGMTKLPFGSRASEKEARLSTNVVWTAEILGNDVSWLDFGESTSTSQMFTVKDNDLSEGRQAEVKFTSKGFPEELTTTITIVQRDRSGDSENATPTTLADIFAYTGGPGEIQGNVYVEGYVISDYTTRNLGLHRSWTSEIQDDTFDEKVDYERRLMFFMDDNNDAMMFEFTGGGMNDVPVDSKVKVHLIDQTILVDEKSGSLKIGSLDFDSVFSVEESDGIAPIELASLDNIGDYENKLVKINNVQFALPYGTYFNVDDRKVSSPLAADDIGSYKFGETPRQYGHRIQDVNGNTIKLMTDCTFTDRFKRIMPLGSGSLTAIVRKEKVWDQDVEAYVETYQLRIRSDEDNQIDPLETTRLSTGVVRFGPFDRYAESASKVQERIQGAQIKTSVTQTLGSSSGLNMYWAYTYARKEPADVFVNDATGQMVVEPDLDELDAEGLLQTAVYQALNVARFWKSGEGTSIPDADGEAWIITFSTEHVTGDLWLTFDTSSSQSGPGSLDLEWHTNENALVAEWNPISRIYIPNWDTNLSCMQYSFKMPDEMKGLPNVVIRHRAVLDRRARWSGAGNGSTGTNRIGAWWLEEKK